MCNGHFVPTCLLKNKFLAIFQCESYRNEIWHSQSQLRRDDKNDYLMAALRFQFVKSASMRKYIFLEQAQKKKSNAMKLVQKSFN